MSNALPWIAIIAGKDKKEDSHPRIDVTEEFKIDDYICTGFIINEK